MEFLESEYNWQGMVIYIRNLWPGQEVHEWCDQRGYLCEVRYSSMTICAPSEQDLLMTRLRFSEHVVLEQVLF
jgi:hypothetical protein